MGASFYNAETSEPVDVLYVGSSGNGNVVLKEPKAGALSMRRHEVVVASGTGAAKLYIVSSTKTGESRWSFSGLTEGSMIHALDGENKILHGIPVPVTSPTLSRWVSDIAFSCDFRSMKTTKGIRHA